VLTTRRKTLRLIVAASGIGVLAACGTPAPPVTAPTAAPPTTAAAPTLAPAAPPTQALAPAPTQAQTTATSAFPTATAVEAPTSASGAKPTTGGTLRIGQIGDLVNLEPHFFQNTTSENTWLAYDRLTQYDLQFKPQPMLAEKWDLSSDATQITLSLRPGVQFHSGRELTSDDVKYTFERIRDPKVGVGQFAIQGTWFNTVETPDKYTVVLKSDQPRPQVFDLLEQLNIVDRTSLESPDAATKLVGTGPFMLGEWSQGDHATFMRNPNYWQSGHPYLDSVRTSFLRDAAAMVLQLESGALDMIRYPSKQDFVRLTSNPSYQGITYPGNVSAYAVGVSVYTPPLDNKRIRQALNYAINRQRFSEVMLQGVGTSLSLPWAPGYPMYEASKENYYTFDLDKAKSLLNQEGVTSLSLDMIPSPTYPEGDAFCQMYQSDLATIGVTLNIINLDQGAWSDQVNNRRYRHLYYAASILNLSPGTLFTVSRPIGPTNNNEGYEDSTYANLVTDLTRETDPSKLSQVYSQINDILLDQSFFMFMAPNAVLMLARNAVHDVNPNAHGGWSLSDAWLA
jgi:peptide/nickel transport system substrate-binding protein